MAGIPVSSCVRMTVPIAGLSPDHEAPGSFPTVTTLLGNEHVGNARKREQPLDERRPSGAFPWSSKKNGPPGCTVRLTVNLHVSGSASEVSAGS